MGRWFAIRSGFRERAGRRAQLSIWPGRGIDVVGGSVENREPDLAGDAYQANGDGGGPSGGGGVHDRPELPTFRL